MTFTFFKGNLVFQFKTKRSAALGLLTASAIGAMGLFAPMASAAVTGTLAFSEHTGLATDAFSVTTSAACSGGTNLQVYLSGGTGANAFPANFGATQNGAQSLYQVAPNGGLIIPLSQTMAAYAQQAGVTLAPGQYTFDAICKNAFGATVFDDFQGSIWFTSATAFQDTNPALGTPTTTTVANSVASPVNAGTPVTFTATVSPATATGTVQFMDGATALGAPVAVANGTAASAPQTLAAGTHPITAVYTPTGAFAGSTSGVDSFVVNSVQQQPTTTALAVSPAATAQQNTAVTLTANVLPAGAAGTIQFSDNGANLGAPVTVSGGAATLTTSTLAVGNHSFVATFTAANTAAFGNSASAAIVYSITPITAPTATETITTTLLPGALVISVPDGQVTLPSPTLDNAGDLFTTSGALKPVTVTDNRSGNPGWTVNGQVSDFSDGASHAINGENLGWSPNVVDHSGGQTIALGGVVAPANGVAPSDTGANGLKGSHALAVAAAGAGLGTAHLAAALSLNVPTTTVAGTYVATLTLTVGSPGTELEFAL